MTIVTTAKIVPNRELCLLLVTEFMGQPVHGGQGALGCGSARLRMVSV